MIKLLSLQKRYNKSIKELTETITTSFHMRTVIIYNCLEPSFEPKATEHINEMINMALRI